MSGIHRGWISSLILAIAIEGTPARTIPCSVLKINSIVKLSPINGVRTQSRDAANMDPTIICLLTTTSEIEPTMSMLTDKASVVNVRERLELAGVKMDDSLQSGMSGCAGHTMATILNPAAK